MTQQKAKEGDKAVRIFAAQNVIMRRETGDKIKQQNQMIQQRVQVSCGEKVYMPVIIGMMNENIARKQQFWNSLFDHGSSSGEKKEVDEVSEKDIVPALDPDPGINE
ncbi:OLC1v1037044C1 [Oldenlandia corymbosa var. corymbosa]|uniref:OLC1v1037044C1 n=1 Tax=Oldenlandia corymbosa var. corymbosa TaxID=529605 RepID=A0AAV1CWM6_OLDCO|nr:OLC1v1037044C1 [Oldenlandia corymbosa var. corymbosa]